MDCPSINISAELSVYIPPPSKDGALGSPYITFIFAHRGASAYEVGNTMESFKLGIEMGADGLESDVQKSVDGHLVFYHDFTVIYNGFPTQVSSLTLKELQAIDLGMGRHIPSVVSVFDYFKGRTNNYGYPICYSIDIKNMLDGSGENLITLAQYMGLEQNINITLNDNASQYWKYAEIYRNVSPTVSLVNSSHIWYMQPGCLPLCCPGIHHNYVYYKHWKDFEKYKYSAINVSSSECSNKIISDTRMHNFNIWVWGCNSLQVIDKYLNDKVDAIMSDHPDWAVQERLKLQVPL